MMLLLHLSFDDLGMKRVSKKENSTKQLGGARFKQRSDGIIVVDTGIGVVTRINILWYRMLQC